MPTRVRKPKDKPNVEGTVGIISTWILAAIRNQEFFSLAELNQAIAEKLAEFNAKPFQRKPGSRQSVFLEEEQAMLLPLPKMHYELAIWKTTTVQFNYHIAVDGMFYSVPYEFIKHRVDVRVTRTVVEAFFQNSLNKHSQNTVSSGARSTMAGNRHAKRGHCTEAVRDAPFRHGEQFSRQMRDHSFEALSFEERFGLLVDSE
jgi:hypothetical protein